MCIAVEKLMCNAFDSLKREFGKPIWIQQKFASMATVQKYAGDYPELKTIAQASQNFGMYSG